MGASRSLRPGAVLGKYPQKKDSMPGLLEQMVTNGLERANRLVNYQQFQLRYIVNRVNQYQPKLEQLSETAMTEHILQLRQNLFRNGLETDLIAQSFATIREVSGRTLDKRHFDVQLLGGWVMMNGMVAEMETGQGKTLTATLASCTAALTGIPVHVITANDYLVSRDATILKPLYQRLGLNVGTVVEGVDAEQRRMAYACDVVHTTNKQIAFDYLRDRMEMGDDIGSLRLQFKQLYQEQKGSSQFLLRGLCFAIVDEADSVLIDEARTPLIISKNRQDTDKEQTYRQALSLAESLEQTADFVLNPREREVSFTDRGRSRMDKMAKNLSGIWAGRRRCAALVKQALTAQYLFQRDKDYLVRDGKIQIIDEQTGRVMADRAWEQGLHQLIEIKEGCEITGQREPLARISYQRFFRRYLRLAGMSGTVKETARELWSVYRLHVVKVPTHQPSNRILLPERVYRTTEEKWKAFVHRVRELNELGRPVLIGTCSVAESDHISRLLVKQGVEHLVLNARQDQNEAQIIAKAGQRKQVTVATNMAGRGTDIQLTKAVEEIGGLHVIATERNEARRIDRQLYGRCARQGDPGSAEAFLSLQDKNIELYYPRAILQVLGWFGEAEKPIPNLLGRIILALPQKRSERQHRYGRRLLLKMEEQIARTLAFSGRLE